MFPATTTSGMLELSLTHKVHDRLGPPPPLAESGDDNEHDAEGLGSTCKLAEICELVSDISTSALILPSLNASEQDGAAKDFRRNLRQGRLGHLLSGFF